MNCRKQKECIIVITMGYRYDAVQYKSENTRRCGILLWTTHQYRRFEVDHSIVRHFVTSYMLLL